MEFVKKFHEKVKDQIKKKQKNMLNIKSKGKRK